jgi:stress response protein YsnF
MPRVVTARYESEQAAEHALAVVGAEVPLLDSAVLSKGPAASFTLDSLDLSREERAGCEQQLTRGGFLLVAQVASGAAAEAALRVLRGMAGRSDAQATPAAPASAAAPAPAVAVAPTPVVAPAPAVAPPQTTAEERIPIVEEELRIGKREVLRGGARVHTFTTEVPVQEQVELTEERASVERRPANRRLTEAEVVEGGLLQERVIEISEMREEAVVSKEAFVREEIVVRKTVERRTEQIHETVRRTEVETEALQPER